MLLRQQVTVMSEKLLSTSIDIELAVRHFVGAVDSRVVSN